MKARNLAVDLHSNPIFNCHVNMPLMRVVPAHKMVDSLGIIKVTFWTFSPKKLPSKIHPKAKGTYEFVNF